MPRYESPYDPSTMPRNLEHVLYEKKGHVAYVTLLVGEIGLFGSGASLVAVAVGSYERKMPQLP